MNMKKIATCLLLGGSIGLSATVYAGCNAQQISGTWEAAFSDGNSCRLKVKPNGAVDSNASVCFDPDRGTADIDSGTLKPKGDCFAEGEIVISGVSIELPVQFSHDRSLAAGRFRVSADGSKGSVVMVRVH